VLEGHKHMAEVGFARFSAREVAKRIGYSVGTLYNVFGTYDRLILAINTRTFELWTEHLRQRLEKAEEDRIRTLVEGYFSFARDNTNLWMAIYDHHLPSGAAMPDEFGAIRGKLTELVEHEVSAALPKGKEETVPLLARSLIASVHGHCTFALNGTFALMGIEEPMKLAVARAREAIAAAH
jgi:AcrR family transcriptional regulator